MERHKRLNITNLFRNRVLLILDVLVVLASYLIIALIQQDIYDALERLYKNIIPILLSIAYFIISLRVLGLYSILWVMSGTKDYLRILVGTLYAAFFTIITDTIFFRNFYPKTYIFAMILACFGIVSVRLLVHALYVLLTEGIKEQKNFKRLMIVGTGNAAMMAVKDIANNSNLNYEVVCFVDDDKRKLQQSINGIKVIGTTADINRIVTEWGIDTILFAIPSATAAEKKRIIQICNNTECEVKTLPGIDEMINVSNIISQARNISIEDLLERDPIVLDNNGIKNYIENKVILVTGGGGSIGSELCRQVMKYNPKLLVIFDIYENNAYDLQMELNHLYPFSKPEVIIGSVRDINRLENIFEQYKPYIVFHAAAHKHVPLMENSPGEAIKNNVFGTLNVAKCADKFKTKRFVMISTDKAVNPTNVMGATKRICEMIVQTIQQNSKTEYVAVRFGNVLGSNGSVIPLFKKQIQEGGPVLVTHRDITRFFMTIPEAAELVLQAASYAKGGEIFVLDMGKPVKIYDLARNLIRLSGYVPDKDIKINIIGLRPGEKLYEELLMNEEGLTNTEHNKIFIGKPINIDKIQLTKILNRLYIASESNNTEKIKDIIAEVVTTYKRPKRKEEI